MGEKWSLLALREVFLGYRRFDQMVANTGAPRDILTARLRKLVDAGELDRVQYSERPPRFEYVLTETGRDLHPVLMALMHFGDRHLSPGDRPPVEWTHNGDHVLKPELTCAECAGSVTPETLRAATPAR